MQGRGFASHGGDDEVVVAFHAVQPDAGGSFVLEGDGDFLFLGFLRGVALLQLAQVLAGGVQGDGVALLHHLCVEPCGKAEGLAVAVLEGNAHVEVPVIGAHSVGADQLHGDGQGPVCAYRRAGGGDIVAADGGRAERHVKFAVVPDREGLGTAAGGGVLLQGPEVHIARNGNVAGDGVGGLVSRLVFFFFCRVCRRFRVFIFFLCLCSGAFCLGDGSFFLRYIRRTLCSIQGFLRIFQLFFSIIPFSLCTFCL